MAATFSIIVVTLNAGEKLNQTLDSILCQTCKDYEIIVKDGGSKDGSIEGMRCNEQIKLFVEKDTGIYDAMNQAVSHAEGDFVLFLNCGDVFYEKDVLKKVKEYLVKPDVTKGEPLLLYGDTFSTKNHALIASPPVIDGFTCYRNIPCHQSCFYATKLCKEKPYNPTFRIRADYDHFLWCYYVAKARFVYVGITVAAYEGGGYSESKENGKRDKEEHKLITKQYMSKKELFRYGAIMALTLAPLRRQLAQSKCFSKIYHKVKQVLYNKRG